MFEFKIINYWYKKTLIEGQDNIIILLPLQYQLRRTDALLPSDDSNDI